MVRVSVIIFAIIIYGCGATSENVKKSDEQYRQAHDAANMAFTELDTNGSHATEKPAPTGNTNYDRQQSAAADAFKDLGCSAEGICESSSKSAPEDKARSVALNEKPIERGVSNYPFQDGYPVWFIQPFYDGYLGGVGVAKEQRGGYPSQKRVAVALAQADLARNVRVSVYSEAVSERINIDTNVQKHYQEKFSTLSRQQAEEYLNNPIIMDEWLDKKSGELYVWVALPR